MKRLGFLGILALCGCQTSGDVDQVASPAAIQPSPMAAGESCAQSRLLLNKYYLTPHQRADLIEAMRAKSCET